MFHVISNIVCLWKYHRNKSNNVYATSRRAMQGFPRKPLVMLGTKLNQKLYILEVFLHYILEARRHFPNIAASGCSCQRFLAGALPRVTLLFLGPLSTQAPLAGCRPAIDSQAKRFGQLTRRRLWPKWSEKTKLHNTRCVVSKRPNQVITINKNTPLTGITQVFRNIENTNIIGCLNISLTFLWRTRILLFTGLYILPGKHASFYRIYII